MSAHTPGPWHFELYDSGDDSVGMAATPAYVYADPDGNGNVYPIGVLDAPIRRADRDPVDEYDYCVEASGSVDGNGTLIAAAPDMLAMLEQVQFLLTSAAAPPESQPLVNGLELVIARARGLPPPHAIKPAARGHDMDNGDYILWRGVRWYAQREQRL